MNNKQNNNLKGQKMEKLKEIPKWSRKYAQNRMLTNLAFFIIYVVLFLGISAPPYFYSMLFKNDNIIVKGICLIVSLSFLVFLLYISVPKWGGLKLWRWIDQRIYHEGNVSIQDSKLMDKTNRNIGKVVPLLFGICIICSMILCDKYIPIEYMQPISAIYCVPFVIFLYIRQRPKYGPLMLLWPILYAIHAILIVAGVPIVFTKDSGLVSLNMFIPTFGYGLLTLIIIYLYSRYALKKLKGVTRMEGDAADGD